MRFAQWSISQRILASIAFRSVPLQNARAYLEAIIKPLVVAGILASVRGKNGGYQLARPASDITAGDVIRAVEGEVASAPCSAEGEPCERASMCRTIRFWMGLENVVDQYLDATNIADLAVPDLAGNDYVI